MSNGEVRSLPTTTNFELIFAAAAPTIVPRTSLYASLEWLPWASETRNPFTLYTANDVSVTHLRANAPAMNLGLSVALLAPAQTNHRLSVAANLGDLYSPAARPEAGSSYTHKLDFQLYSEITPFPSRANNRLSKIAVFTVLDYVATGLPHAGDEIPKGVRVFMTGARPLALVLGLVIPLTMPKAS